MDKKVLKQLKAAWPKVKKTGGYFGVVLNGWPQDPDAELIFLVDRKKVVDRAYVQKKDRTADLNGKSFFGKVVVDDDGMVFNISPTSRSKSPQLLKKSLRHLAENEELAKLKLKQLRRPVCQMDAEITLDGTAEVDGKEDAKARGGRASLRAKLTGSTYTKLLKLLEKWERVFGNQLSASNLSKANKALGEIRDKAKAWADKHPDRGDTERGQQVDAIRKEVIAAQRRVSAFRDGLKRDQAADQTFEDVSACKGDLSLLGTPEETLDRLVNAKQSLERRLGTVTDPDELTVLREAADNVNRLLGRAQLARETELAVEALRNDEQEPLPTEDRKRALLVLHARCRELLDTVDGADLVNQKQIVDQLVSVIDQLEAAGSTREADALRATLSHAAMKQTSIELAEQLDTDDVATAVGSLQRGNGTASVIRSRIVRNLGKEHGDEVMAPLLDVVQTHPLLKPGRYDITEEPEAMQAHEELRAQRQAFDAAVSAAELPLVERVRARLGLEHLNAREFHSSIYSIWKMVLISNAPTPPAPSVDEVLEACRNDGTVVSAFAKTWAERALTFLEQDMSVVDTDPAATRTALEAHIRDTVKTTGWLSLDELLAGFTSTSRDEPPNPDLLAIRLHNAGLLPQGDPALDDMMAETDAILASLAVDDARTAVEDAGQNLMDKSPVTMAGLLGAFTAVMDRILLPPDRLPKGIQEIVLSACKDAADHGAGRAGMHKMVADIVVLRWFTPQMNTMRLPDPSNPELTVNVDTAVQVGALIQAVANGVLIQRDGYEGFAPTLAHYIARFETFIDDFLALATETVVSIEDGDHPTLREQSFDATLDEAKYADDMDGHWRFCTMKVLRGALLRASKRRSLLVHWNTWTDALGDIKAHHTAHFADEDALAPGFKNKSKLLNECLDLMQDLVDAEVEAVAAGEDSVMLWAVDESERYTVNEHWTDVMVPRMNGLVNRLTSQERFAKLGVMSDLTPLYAPIELRHAGVFDPAVHADLPQKDDKLDPLLRPLFDAAARMLAHEMQRTLDGSGGGYFALGLGQKEPKA